MLHYHATCDDGRYEKSEEKRKNLRFVVNGEDKGWWYASLPIYNNCTPGKPFSVKKDSCLNLLQPLQILAVAAASALPSTLNISPKTSQPLQYEWLLCLHPNRVETCASDVWRRLSVAYIGSKSRTERPRKTKIGTEVAYVTRDWDTTFKVKRSTCRGRRHIVVASRTAW